MFGKNKSKGKKTALNVWGKMKHARPAGNKAMEGKCGSSHNGCGGKKK